MMFRPLPVLTVLSAVSLVILLWLGSWQWDRYSTKVAHADAGPPEWDKLLIENTGQTPLTLKTVLFGESVWKVIVPVANNASGNSQFAVVELILSLIHI